MTKKKKITPDELEKLIDTQIEQKRSALGVDYDHIALSQQHNIETGEFSDLTKQYQDNTSLESYIELRRANPDKLIEVSTSWSLDWLLANESTVRANGIDPDLVAGALDADAGYISELSLCIMERLVEREALVRAGKTQVQSRGEGINDSLVNYLISMMLDALDRYDELYIPRDLIVLIKHMLGADRSFEAKAMEAHSRRTSAIWTAAQMEEDGQPCSMRTISTLFEVSPSTVSRWFPNGEFEEEVARVRGILRSDFMRQDRETREKIKKNQTNK